MGLTKGLICIFRGHVVSSECQKALKKSEETRFITKCRRCGYPVRIEAIDAKRFYVTELDSAKELFPEKFK